MQWKNILDLLLNYLEIYCQILLADFFFPYFSPKWQSYHFILLFLIFYTQRPRIACYVICLEESLLHFSSLRWRINVIYIFCWNIEAQWGISRKLLKCQDFELNVIREWVFKGKECSRTNTWKLKVKIIETSLILPFFLIMISGILIKWCNLPICYNTVKFRIILWKDALEFFLNPFLYKP